MRIKMKQPITLRHEFVQYVPDKLKERTLYISVEFASVVHKCCCGCGNEVVTPLSPNDWKLIFNGETISLYPSIGNWNFPCHSHYWIDGSQVKWASQWSQERINAGRAYYTFAKNKHYSNSERQILPNNAPGAKEKDRESLWHRIMKLFC
jgi:hypothetical protein